MSKRKVHPSTLLSMIDNDIPSRVGARRQFYFSMPRPINPKKGAIQYGYPVRRRRCCSCKTMIELSEIRVQAFDPAGTTYERTKNYHFLPCFGYALSKFITQLDDSIRTIVRFREKYDLPNK